MGVLKCRSHSELHTFKISSQFSDPQILPSARYTPLSETDIVSGSLVDIMSASLPDPLPRLDPWECLLFQTLRFSFTWACTRDMGPSVCEDGAPCPLVRDVTRGTCDVESLIQVPTTHHPVQGVTPHPRCLFVPVPGLAGCAGSQSQLCRRGRGRTPEGEVRPPHCQLKYTVEGTGTPRPNLQ